jgi:hypothetical protein
VNVFSQNWWSQHNSSKWWLECTKGKTIFIWTYTLNYL